MPREYPSQPIAAVGVVVLNGNDVLLIQRGKPPKEKEWSLPGGAQELGETLHDTARREVLEETGLEITVSGLVDVVDFIEKDANQKVSFHYSLIDFWAESTSRSLIPGDDAASAQWVAHDRIDDIGLWRETTRVIHQAFAMRDKRT
ncbi:MAG: NUDIX hydrolase [Pseudomonadota bacterium]